MVAINSFRLMLDAVKVPPGVNRDLVPLVPGAAGLIDATSNLACPSEACAANAGAFRKPIPIEAIAAKAKQREECMSYK